MSVCASNDFDKFENNENIPANGYDVGWGLNEFKDCPGSQELFSDDDQPKNTSFVSPRVTTKNDISSNSSILLKTPIFLSKTRLEETPGKAVVPTTPVDLLPFIKKTSFLWTSDMETPERKSNEKAESSDKTLNSTDIVTDIHNSKTPVRKTPSKDKMEVKKLEITSPVLGGKKRIKRKVKRRILSLNLDPDNNNKRQESLGSSNDKVPSEATDSTSRESILDIESDRKSTPRAKKDSVEEETKENKNVEKINHEKNSNTSTQDFFSNASFSSIDRLCTAIQAEKSSPSTSTGNEKSKAIEKIPHDNSIEQIQTKESKGNGISHDILSRVAAIRRNQKPLRRSIDISNAVIPKEIFSKSVIELELADKNFSQEKKPILNLPKPQKTMSFTKLSLLEKESNMQEEKVPQTKIKSELDEETIMDIKSEKEDSSVKINSPALKKEEQKINPILTNINNELVTENLSDDGFSTANGRNIAISEDKIRNFEKIYSEIESEIPDKTDDKPKSLQLNFGKNNKLKHQRILEIKDEESEFTSSDNKSETLQLFEDLETQEFLQPNFSMGNSVTKSNQKIKSGVSSTIVQDDCFATVGSKSIKKSDEKGELIKPLLSTVNDQKASSNEIRLPALDVDNKLEVMIKAQSSNDGFSTAGGKGIKVNTEKESYYLKIFNELGEDDNNEESSVLTKSVTRKSIVQFNKNTKESIKLSEPVLPSEGFATAGGKGIKVNTEKENHYLRIFNEIEDDVPGLNKIDSRKSTNQLTATPSSDGFSTAGGKGIKVNTEKENHYLRIFNEIEDDVPGLNKIDSRKSTNQLTKAISSDGFSTAGGKGIKVNTEKENHYLRIFNEIEDAVENKDIPGPSKVSSYKSANQQLMSCPTQVINSIRNKTKSESSSNGFSTAGGKGIAVDTEREKFYQNIFNELGEENISTIKTEPKSKIVKGKTPTPHPSGIKVNTNPKKSSSNGFSTAGGKGLAVDTEREKFYENLFNELGQEDIPIIKTGPKSKIVGGKSPISNETEDALLDFGDLAEFFSPPHQNEEITDKNSDFIIPNSQNIVQQNLPTTKETKSHVNAFKRKFETTEVKRTERCKSFGGFPMNNNEGVTKKLNKSDPNNELFVNQPLQKDLSASQCFDLHSDSWLSKVEISYLNSSKIKSPDTRLKKIKLEPVDNRDFFGFSFQDCTTMFRQYSRFKNFLKKQDITQNECMDLDVEAGHTVSISNRTSTKQTLSVIQSKNVDMKKLTNSWNYILVEKKPELEIEKPKVKIIEKRKHADTDSDTPLTTIKKPRVGTDLQGRRLFSGDSDDEEMNQEVQGDKKEENVPVAKVKIELTEEELEVLAEQRMIAILQQDKQIRNKKRIKVRPTMGTLLRERLANSKNRVSWSRFVNESTPQPRNIQQIKENHPDARILEITASNATCYKFLTSNIVGNKRVVSLDVGDGATLIFDKNGHAGVSEFTQAFLAMPGVDLNLIPVGWIENHYRWIVWKLASMDRIHFNSVYIPKMLTPERVMKDLKYRYDREIDKAERPALRRILEKDDVASRRMVLCISSIKECATTENSEKEVRVMLGLPRWRVEATDGWYSIPLTIDNAMVNYISAGKIKEGTKIITYGAELMECERGFFPLEKPPNVSLKIHTNCTRRARWDMKLGYQKNSRPLPVKLRNIISFGGMIGETTAVAARVYPILYREKTADGKSIYRNARSEEKAAIAHEKTIEKKLDSMYAQAQKNFDSRKKSDSDEDVENSQSSKSQVKTSIQKFNNYERKQEEFKQRLESEMRQSLPPKRNVTAVLKVRLADDKTTVILTIWGASEDSDCDIKEGDTITVYNSFASGTRNGELNLTANRITHIKTEPLLRLPFPHRLCTLIPDIGGLCFEPKFSEFDTVGVVVSSGAAPFGMRNFEMVNMAYPKQNDSGSSFMTILFWDGIASFGYQGIFSAGTIVACSNLEWRRNTSWSIAVAYCSEKTVFTCNPRQTHLVKELRNLKALVQNPTSYAKSCNEELNNELSKKPQPRSSQSTPSTSFSGSLHNVTSMASPLDNYSPGNSMIQRKIEKLSRYGTSPEISPMVLNSSSSRLKKDFTPVTRKNS